MPFRECWRPARNLFSRGLDFHFLEWLQQRGGSVLVRGGAWPPARGLGTTKACQVPTYKALGLESAQEAPLGSFKLKEKAYSPRTFRGKNTA